MFAFCGIGGNEIGTDLLPSDHWLICEFPDCRDKIASEDSGTLRHSFLELLEVFKNNKETLREQFAKAGTPFRFEEYRKEINSIIAASATAPVSVWIYGDEHCEALLKKTVLGLPSPNEQQAVTGLISMKKVYDFFAPW